MDEPQILATIISETYTRADLNRRLSYIRSFCEQVLFGSEVNVDLASFLKKKGATSMDISVMTGWGDDFFNFFNSKNLYKVLKSLDIDLKSLPVATIYLPYEHSAIEINKLGKWFRDSLNSDILLDIKVNQNLLGGCAFVWKGIYKEFDLHFFLQRSKEELLKIFESYANEPNRQYQ